ncbi:PH domain-containing protein [Alcanivorax sp. 1008]|uniref:PH domain-containing protein n=1 Tax=Alcanivorax sp. 1008 TaxID=2816853 RepID=UPI001D48EF77|nr:PH domain-containing protein [Alcanivorax sp. 1008]MCC1496802.1 PH domain-containing protein [Alcanivorax sp. 1008]
MKNGVICKGKRHPAGMYPPAALIVVGAAVWGVGALTIGADVVLHIMALASVFVGFVGVVSVAMDIAGFSINVYSDRVTIQRGALLARGTTEIPLANIAEVQLDRSWLTRLMAPSAGVITLSLSDGRSGSLPLLSNAEQVARTLRGLASPAGVEKPATPE